jgi:hypothetical protein
MYGLGTSGLQAFGAENGGRVEPQRRGQPATRRAQRRPTNRGHPNCVVGRVRVADRASLLRRPVLRPGFETPD